MKSLEQQLPALEARSALFESKEQQRRMMLLQHLSVINRFEGIVASKVDQRLFKLLASGQISKQEYLDLCVDDACSTVQT